VKDSAVQDDKKGKNTVIPSEAGRIGRRGEIPEAVDPPKRSVGKIVPDRRLVQDPRLRDPSPG